MEFWFTLVLVGWNLGEPGFDGEEKYWDNCGGGCVNWTEVRFELGWVDDDDTGREVNRGGMGREGRKRYVNNNRVE